MADINWVIARRRHLAQQAALADSGMPLRTAKGTRQEADRLMEYRSFGTLTDEGSAVAYYRGEKERPDIIVIVRFEDGVVGDVTTSCPPGSRTRDMKKPRKGRGFEELYSVAQVNGD